MKFLFLFSLSLIQLLALSVNNPIQGHIYKVGERLLDFQLDTPHDKRHQLNDNTRYIMVTYDKISTQTQNDFVASVPNFLKRFHTLLIVDVSVVPSGIFTLFVNPRMKHVPHPLLYSFDVNFSKMFPYKENHITILELKDKVLKKVVFVDSEVGLKEVFTIK